MGHSPEQITYEITNEVLTNTKRIEIIPCIISDHNAMKLETTHKEKLEDHRYKEVQQHATKQRWINQEIKEEIKKNTWKLVKVKHNSPNPVGCSKSTLMREVHSNTGLP